ncbi:alpha/beta fold hydrolase [Variovorax boronicumulans]|uniref:alpha/beta fold hydrolase n=1 Tax=Variovorax boronicumulans TaxID=436515 RepID=UPI001C574EC5
MITSEDFNLLRQALPAPSTVQVASNVFAGGVGQIEYRTRGPAQAPAVLLLHGIGSSSAGYRAQLAGLADAFRVIAWNAPGFGNSTPLASETPGAQDYAQALGDFIAALGIRRLAVLVGSSWGSVIAATFATLSPATVPGLVLSAPNTARGRLQGDARAAELAGLVRAGASADRRAVADRLLTPDTSAEVRAHVEALRDAVTPSGWRQAAHMLFTVHTPDLLAHYGGHLAIVAGTRDQVAPLEAHGAVLHAAAPASRLHVLEGYGHMPKLEAPARFNAIVRTAAQEAEDFGAGP